jgi:hypothetical protein
VGKQTGENTPNNRENATHRKVTVILKGPHQSVQSTNVPVNKWFHSQKNKELYRFNEGVFEAHTTKEGNEYWNCYTQKVPHDDHKDVTVAETAGGQYMVVSVNQCQPEWKKLTEPTVVNATLSQRNKCHLQQMLYECRITIKKLTHDLAQKLRI